MPNSPERKAMLAERRQRQHLPPDVPWYDGWRKQWLSEYRKSIWPSNKVAKPGRMG